MRRIKKLKIASPNFTFYIFNFTFCHAASRMILSDRKSTRLNSSHSQISYAVFCLKKKKMHEAKLGEHIHAVHGTAVELQIASNRAGMMSREKLICLLGHPNILNVWHTPIHNDEVV